jgi:hypothetical protein
MRPQSPGPLQPYELTDQSFIGKLQQVKPSDEYMTQPIRHLMTSIRQLATPENCLFTAADLRALVPDQIGWADSSLKCNTQGFNERG